MSVVPNQYALNLRRPSHQSWILLIAATEAWINLFFVRYEQLASIDIEWRSVHQALRAWA